MMYKNTFRLFFSNANNIWKTLLYMIVSILIFGLSALIVLPIIRRMNDYGIFSSLISIATSLFVMWENGTLGTSLVKIFHDTIAIATDPTLIWYLVVFAIIIVLARYILGAIYVLSMSDNLYNYMSSGYKSKYRVSLAKMFPRGIILGLVKIIIAFPIDILTVYVLSLCIKLFTLGDLYAIFAPFIIFLTISVLWSIRLTILCGWEPAMCVHDCGVFKALKYGLVAVGRRFWRTLSCAFALNLTLIAVNVFACLFTAGSCLVITIPSTLLLNTIFGSVMYFSSHGMRFYVEDSFVISPKRKEASDSARKSRYTL